VKGLETGIYQYRPESHELWLKIRGDRRSMVDNGQGMVIAAPFTLVYSAVFERTTRRYGQRGRERYVWIDLGHSAENVYLQATAMGMGTCAVGAFHDATLHRAVGMSPAEQALYIMPVGYPAE
ncbi:MAG: SagB/ThcOx family dehydrogenase, partial [candidate division WOR-3 bacterium]